MSEQLLRQILDKLGRIESEQQFMKTEIQDVKAEVIAIKDTQELFRTQLSETNEIVKAIRDRQEETDAKLDALSMDVNKLHGQFTRLKEGQERHDKLLEKLSVRSIEHEADISELRRIK
ncbi:hypothetical protein [Paenibacillus sp. YPG26]|uniref:hypothetical protein n=1 Tax=Paenibacillus sp. YPG26 TaxID=2878915 RepID=UPI00203F4D4E|nr:hypothetical protein [Paenibacillus sp. YPG26]USB32863.1 hypothetical protein LDO05_16675 [Paenibacillus sp. YPG26]